MGSVRGTLVVCSFFWLAALVPLIQGQADDPLCAGLSDGEVHTFPHEYNCSLYYSCLNGDKTLSSCPEGFYYDAEAHRCEFEELSGCINGSPSECAGISLDYLPDPSDCSKYIQCFNGEAYPMECPSEYYFDSVTKMCVRWWLSDCMLGPTTPPWTTPPDYICYGVRPGQTQLFSYPENCHLYYRCTGSTLTVDSCGTFLFFDEDRQLCDFPGTVDCGGGTRTPDPSTRTPPPTTPPPNHDDPRCEEGVISYWPHPVNCHMYIECYFGDSYEMDCPPGLEFDEDTSHCTLPSLAHCSHHTTVPPRTTNTVPTGFTPDPDCYPYPASEGRLLPFPGRCDLFYECAEGRKVAFACPDYLYFNADPYYCECDYPYHTPCPAVYPSCYRDWSRNSSRTDVKKAYV